MYEIVNIIPTDLLDEVLQYGESARHYRVKVTKSGNVQAYDPDVRSTTGVRIDPRLFPEITDIIESHVDDGNIVNQFDFLIYTKGDRFRRHIDTFSEPDRQDYRKWTTVTALEISDDLQGGGLVVGDSDPIFLEKGQTAIFSSDTEHEALEVLQGTRKVLVAWLGKYKYS